MKYLRLMLVGGFLLTSCAAYAQSTPPHVPGVYAVIGYSSLQPKKDSGTLSGNLDTHINHDSKASIALGYRFNAHMSMELWSPVSAFQHRIELQGVPAATIKHRPVLLTFQYHYRVQTRVQPYFGLGYGVVSLSGQRTEGPLAGSTINVKKGDGLTAQFGVDIFANTHLFVRAEARYLHWNSKVAVNGTDLGKVTLNPWIYSVGLGYRF